jgi:hypothetical protein
MFAYFRSTRTQKIYENDLWLDIDMMNTNFNQADFIKNFYWNTALYHQFTCGIIVPLFKNGIL